MADAVMAPIEALCVAAVQTPHAATEIRLGRFNEQMIMVIHQTVGIALPLLLENFGPQAGQEVVAIRIIEKDRLSGIAPRCEVIERAGVFQPQLASHGHRR
jgi:hypothetical protein